MNSAPPIRQEITLTPPTQRRRGLLLSLLFAAALINYIDRGNLSIAAPILMRSFDFSLVKMGTLLSAFFWTYSLLQIPVGYLVDRYPLKFVYAGAFLLWSIASALVGLSSSFAQIFCMRLVLGGAEAAVTPASLAYIKRHYQTSEQGFATGIFVSGMIIGPAVGSLLGAVILHSFGWRSLFLGTGIGSCLWLIPWLLIAPLDRSLPTTPTNAKRWVSPMRILQPGVFLAITLGAFFYTYYWYFCLTWLPAYLVADRGFSVLVMGELTGFPLLAMAAVTLLSARFADRLIASGRDPIAVRRAFICTGFVLGSSIVLLPFMASRASVFLMLAFSLMGIGVASANYWALSEAICAPEYTGRIIGYQNTVANIAGISAPILTGWLVREAHSYTMAIVISGVALLIAAGSFFLVNPRPLDVPGGAI